MTASSGILRAEWAGWWLRRNPMYLLSAASMAFGARLYLVSPGTRAGDVGLILLTLAILQLYEWAVTSILLTLQRTRRSPEDQPSVLLVAALFWTGPLAATAEMTAHRMVLGLICAAGACVIAISELAVLHRLMGWKLTRTGRLAAAACVLFLAAAPPLLRMPESVSGTNEVFLYAAWWLLAAIGMAALVTVRHHAAVRNAFRELHFELAMLVMVIAATAAHLSGMNYAYFGHAQWFYASPLLIVIAIVMMEYLGHLRTDEADSTRAGLFILAPLLPALAILLAQGRFDERMPVHMLPRMLRDPLMSTLVLASIAWWFGFLRLRDGRLLHMGSLAMAWCCLRALRLFASTPATVIAGPAGSDSTRKFIVVGLYLAAAYLLGMALLRRSRNEAIGAVLLHQVAWTLMLWDRTRLDLLLVCISVGWCWIICMHLAGRPNLTANVLPVLFLLLVTWAYDFAPELRWHARSHAAAMTLILVALALTWSASRYGLIAVCTGLAHTLFYTGHWISGRQNATAAFVVIGAFTLLATGAVISWRKQAILAAVNRPSDPESDQVGQFDRVEPVRPRTGESM